MHGIRTLAACAILAACGGPSKGPETPRVYDNLEATHRLDGAGGHGSAVVIDAEKGLLLTCQHVVGDGQRKLVINIAVGGGEPTAYPATVVASNRKIDLAVVKVGRRFERAVVLGDMSDLHVLDEIYNLGFPYDLGEVGGKGVIKALDYDDPQHASIKDAILAEISDGPGTSGSGVFLARDGKMIGIMQAIVPRGNIDPKTGLLQNDGRQVVFRAVIRIDVVRKFLDDANVTYLTSLPRNPGPWSVSMGTTPPEPITITVVPSAE